MPQTKVNSLGIAAGTLPDGVVWTSTIVTSAMTVAANVGYFVNTSSAAITVTLPASASVGDQIIFTDFNRTWATNNLTLNQNSLNFQGYTSPNPVYNTAGQSVQLVYSGSTQGWIPISDDDVTLETPQTASIDYLVVAGGGGGGGAAENGGTPAAGGGAGGMKTGTTNLTKTNVYTITVGDGGAGQTSAGNVRGNNGSSSSISGTALTTISTTGGGGGGGGALNSGNSGGSGGGAANGGSVGNGTAGEGNNGGSFNGAGPAGGGGGKGAVGETAPNSGTSGAGGAGSASSITGSSVTYAGGGGGGGGGSGGLTAGAGGSGGGGAGGPSTGSTGTSGTVNTGGGGGGGAPNFGSSYTSSSGGKGVVIIRILTADYSGTTTGSPTVTTDGSYKVLTYTGTGSYTA